MGCCGNRDGNKLENKKTCPLCKEMGNNIHHLAISRVVKEEVVSQIREEAYFVCNNKNCDVVFYNEDGSRIFLTQDINMEANFDEITVSKVQKCNCNSKCNTCGDNSSR